MHGCWAFKTNFLGTEVAAAFNAMVPVMLIAADKLL